MKMNMMAAGLNGALLVVAVGPREAIVKEHGRDIVTHPVQLTKAYHVLEPNHGQRIATKNHAVVGDFENPEILFRICYIVTIGWKSLTYFFHFSHVQLRWIWT